MTKQYNKPVCFNAVRAMQRIDELEAENKRLTDENTNLKIRCRILETDRRTKHADTNQRDNRGQIQGA